ncbi:MAG: hypothetical protein ACN6OI_11410 [Flavobacterium sp.]
MKDFTMPYSMYLRAERFSEMMSEAEYHFKIISNYFFHLNWELIAPCT